MIKFKDDIIQRLIQDFNDLSDSAISILQDAIIKTDYLKTDRIIRCIIFLANGNIDELKKFIDNAIYDPRDVMLWVEYENLDNRDFKYKRVRDFNKTFDKCSENVIE